MARQQINDPLQTDGRNLSGIILRRAVTGDAHGISAVFDAAVRHGWTYLGEIACEPMFTLQEWEQIVADHAAPNLLLVAIDGSNSIVGFTAVHPEKGEMFLLFVHPEHAGRGIGRSLLAAADSALCAAGLREAFLFTHEQNKRALAVYHAAGYRMDGSVRESNFRGIALRELRLAKRL
jgi:GNAT superfamily N-acetyltransferase